MDLIKSALTHWLSKLLLPLMTALAGVIGGYGFDAGNGTAAVVGVVLMVLLPVLQWLMHWIEPKLPAWLDLSDPVVKSAVRDAATSFLKRAYLLIAVALLSGVLISGSGCGAVSAILRGETTTQPLTPADRVREAHRDLDEVLTLVSFAQSVGLIDATNYSTVEPYLNAAHKAIDQLDAKAATGETNLIDLLKIAADATAELRKHTPAE